jgi:hypothetical protein
VKVNIVAAKIDNEKRILPRLARILADGTGWSLSVKPSPKADVNYFFPYLEYAKTPTQKVAWFTHKDIRGLEKTHRWDDVAQQVDLRLFSAPIYRSDLEQYGLTFQVTPPLDREKFRISQTFTSHPRPVVGTSGYIYNSGRKGETLLASLRDSKTGRGVEWRATGRGWPVPTKAYLWEDMEKFYQDLDVYVCTSVVEGVGYGPLEALACGIKVVIPRGVGVFDDLPHTPGIVHYEAGNPEDLERALREVLASSVDPEELRSSTDSYTTEAWCKTNTEALEVLSTAGSALPDWQGHSGVYYVAFGEPSRACAKAAIQTWKKFMPEVPVALCSDRPLGGEDILIRVPEVDVGARSQKIRIYDLAPQEWDYVLYLDADTELIQPVPFLFQALQDGWEFLICKNPGKFVLSSHMGRSDNTDECKQTFDLWGTDQMTQWNGGVFSFRRCPRVQRFFQVWHEEWQRWGKRDQGALLRALWRNPPLMYPLGNEWNLVPTYDPVERSAGILHHPMSARRWQGLITGRSDSPEAWAAVRKFEQKVRESSR